jgi:hypothetical protein
MGVPLVYQSTRQKLMPACAPKKEKPLRHHLVTMVRGLVFGGGAIEFQEGVDLDLPDFMRSSPLTDPMVFCLQTGSLFHEHRLNTVKIVVEVQDENSVNPIARKRPTRTLCSLFAIEGHLGKLAFYH